MGEAKPNELNMKDILVLYLEKHGFNAIRGEDNLCNCLIDEDEWWCYSVLDCFPCKVEDAEETQ